MVATASSAAADMSSQFSSTTEPVHNSVGVAVRLGSDGSTGNRSESPANSEELENCAPMDLSSGGAVAAGHLASTPTFMMAAAAAAVANNSTPTSLADSLLNARRLAEFVRAQQELKEEAKIEEKSPPPPPPLVPRKRAWPELQLDLSAMVSEKLKKKEDPVDPASPTESNSSGGGSSATPSINKEVKKRRLDQLLSQKFAKNESIPAMVNNSGKPENIGERRESSEKKNRRKRSSPQNVTLSLRPNSELLDQKTLKNEEDEIPKENEGNSNVKNQLLQIHLAQAALLNQASSNLFPGFPGFANANPAGNPLLYYGYYAQMIQGLQSQQQKLLEQLTGGKKSVSSNPHSPILNSKVKPDMLPSPFQTPKSSAGFSPSRLLSTSTPHSPPSPKYRDDHNASPHNLLSSPLSVSADEPRRRAPRALTGRYVKTGPGASPRTLAILRKKIEERLKLKELLGENSKLYFGALKDQKMKPKSIANSRF